jgi:hypothetical protein
MTVTVSVTVTQVREDGSEGPLEEEMAAALAGPVEQFASMLTWTARQAAPLDHGDRESVIAESGRELQRQLLESTFAIDCAREERAAPLISAAGIRHGTVEKGRGRGVVSIFGPVRAARMAYRNAREANLYPADARWILPEDPYSMGMRALVAYHLAEGGYGQAQEVIAARTGATVGRAQLAQLAGDLAGWVDEFYDQRAFGADTDLPDSDVIMMQADGKGIAMRPGHRKGASAGKEPDAAHPGIKKMAEIVAVADFTPAVRDPGDIAAPPARRRERPGPQARDKWVAASITETIEDMIGVAFNEADRRDPEQVRQRVFLVDGNKQQLSAIAAHAQERGLKVPVLIDFIHVSGYLGKAAAALHPGDPQAAREWADGQRLRVLHGRARAVAATLASVAARARARNSRHDLTDVDKAVTYLTNNHKYMGYDKALAAGWPIATGVIEGACRFVIEDRFGITGARWSPDGADVILKLRAVVVNGDLDDYMTYYKQRYLEDIHLTRYDPASIPHLGLTA